MRWHYINMISYPVLSLAEQSRNSKDDFFGNGGGGKDESVLITS